MQRQVVRIRNFREIWKISAFAVTAPGVTAAAWPVGALGPSWTCAARAAAFRRPRDAISSWLLSFADYAEEAVRAFCCSTGHYRRTIIITSGPGVAYISSNDGNISSTRVTTIRLKIIPHHVVNHPPPGPLHQPSAPAIHVYTIGVDYERGSSWRLRHHYWSTPGKK